MIHNKVYISEVIGGRLDFQYIAYKQNLAQYKFPIVLLSELLKTKPQYGANEAGVSRLNNQSPRYIRITDINEYGVLSDGLGASAEIVDEKYILNNNDILIARSGNTVGKAYIHKSKQVGYPCFFAGYMIRFIVDSTCVIPDYIFILTQLSFYKRWVKVTQRITGQPNINAEEYKTLPIPLPPIKIQQQIVDIYTSAQKAKQVKEQKAQKLLDSIDNFLIDILDVKEVSVNYLQQSIFTHIRDLIGQRLDVSSYKKHFELISSKYENKKLSAVVEITPPVKFNGLSDGTSISFVPMECINEKYGEIKDIRETTVSNAKGFTKFKEGDLLWAKITPCMQNGKSAIARNLINGIGCGSTEFYVMRPKDNSILIDFVYLLLRHKKVLIAAQTSFGGAAGQQRVSNQYLKSVIIPHPPIEIQHKIISEVENMKKQAKQLELEGSFLIESAKKQIEKMILG